MINGTFIFKYMDMIIYLFVLIGSITSSVMLYSGLTTEIERAQTRLKFRQASENTKKVKEEKMSKSELESWFSRAGYPLGLNAIKYTAITKYIILFLLVYYGALPTLQGSNIQIGAIAIIGVLFILFKPNYYFIKFSVFKFFMNKIIEFRGAKKNTEIYMLHDMIINEIQMMEMSRINTYNILRGLRDYFDYLKMDITMLLSEYTTDPDSALNQFAVSIGTKEAKALVSVLKTLDNNSRETALTSLRGMNTMFVALGVESYRRRRKLITDLASIPMKGAIFLSVLNILAVTIAMLTIIMAASKTM